MLSFVVAHSDNRVIANESGIPWQGQMPADLKRFRDLTLNHIMVMGSSTFKEFEKPLPHRRHVVMTRDQKAQFDGAEVIHSVEEVLELDKNGEEIMIIGGGKIFELLMPHVHRMYITVVHAAVDGSVFFPEYDLSDWNTLEEKRFAADTDNKYDYTFLTLERKIA